MARPAVTGKTASRHAALMLSLVTTAVATLGISSAQGAHDGDESVTRDEFDRMCMTQMGGMMDMMTNMTPESMMGMCMMPMPPGMMNATNEEHERMFLMRMVMHHRAAVAIADMAMERAGHMEIKDLARNISTSQMDEMENMTRWLGEWHNATPPNDTMMDRMMQRQLGAMANMSGDEFDKAFLDHMILHHEAAVNMSKPMADRMPRNETRDTASAVVTTQQAEIDRMRSWRSSWFPTAAASPATTPPVGDGESTRDAPGPGLSILVAASFIAGFALRRRR